ncbi:phage head-tail joining protein [Oricola thermophila]|uniref:Uncharacterized protein n=1 Tax=Oricola thermophila TaxID=2742145 RepID=A0A6N1VH64_9HYPH|nr:hypothetical protein [Oricola thermophila]QKV20251.1 hypothetical protein HTY61_18230 [Oricola thermophila]
MAWTQADLDKLDEAIATGARRVKFQNHEVEYHSMSDMLKARDVIAAALDETRRPSVSFAEYDGGQ